MLNVNVQKKKHCIWKESRLNQRRSQQLTGGKLCFGLVSHILSFLHLLPLCYNPLCSLSVGKVKAVRHGTGSAQTSSGFDSKHKNL